MANREFGNRPITNGTGGAPAGSEPRRRQGQTNSLKSAVRAQALELVLRLSEHSFHELDYALVDEFLSQAREVADLWYEIEERGVARADKADW